CTDVSIVNTETNRHDEQRFGVLLGPAVGDGRGGLWAIIRERHIDQGYEVRTLPGGYAHLHDGRGGAGAEAPVGHMDMHRAQPAQLAPTALAADGRGGAIVVTDDELATIDLAGNVSGRGSIQCQTRAVVAAGDDAIVICDEPRHPGGDPSPELRRIAIGAARE